MGMPFSRDYYFGRFKADELARLQQAYIQTCTAIGCCPVTSPLKDELVREIIQIYECGVFQPEKIAELMKQIESVKHRAENSPTLDQFGVIQSKTA